MDEKLPRHGLVSGGQCVEARHLVGKRVRIGARLDQQDAKTARRQIGSERSAARAGTDHDVVVGGSGVDRFLRHQNVFNSSMSASFSPFFSPVPNSWPLSSTKSAHLLTARNFGTTFSAIKSVACCSLRCLALMSTSVSTRVLK